MTWRISRQDVSHFRRDLWKDERAFPMPSLQGQFVKDCFDEEHAVREEAVLTILSELEGEPLAPRLVTREGSRVVMTVASGMRMFEVLRALKALEHQNRDGKSERARQILIARQRQRLARIQAALLSGAPQLNTSPYPMREKLDSLLVLLTNVLGVRFDEAARASAEKFASYWERNCCQIPFRDATSKNTIVVHPRLERMQRSQTGEADVECVHRLLEEGEDRVWEEVGLMDVDFSSAEHLTTLEDDPISLHFHEWTYGSCPLEPTSLLLLPAEGLADAYRTATTFLVRYMRFGGRKLAYKLINAQGFEIRFRYDDPLFYFRELPHILSSLSQDFCADFEPLLSVVKRIGTSAANPTPADKHLVQVDHFRTVFKAGTDYWDENPIDLRAQ